MTTDSMGKLASSQVEVEDDSPSLLKRFSFAAAWKSEIGDEVSPRGVFPYGKTIYCEGRSE
jgi:hypothetical protein